MTEQSVSQSKNYISATEAAKLIGYSSDYVARLAREGKIAAQRVKRQWFVEPESLKLFSLEAASEKRKRQEQLKQERVKERTEILLATNNSAIAAQIKTSQTTALAQTIVLSICLFLFSNIIWISFESHIDTHALIAGASEIRQKFSESIVASLPDFLSQPASFAFIHRTPKNLAQNQPSNTADTNRASSDQPEFQGIVLFNGTQVSDKQLNAVRKSFSDEVQVDFDSDDSGIVTPVFKERTGDSYRFLLVPVHASDS